MKTLLALLITLTTLNLAHAGDTQEESTRRLVGSCIAVQSARLDNGSLPLDVISKAVAAGCMPVLRTALAKNKELSTATLSTALLQNQKGDEFDVSYALEDMAANAVAWLRGPGHTHQQELRGTPRVLVATAQ